MTKELNHEVRNIQTATARSISRNGTAHYKQSLTSDYEAEIAALRAECERLSKGWEQEIKTNAESNAQKYHNMNLAWHAPGMGEIHSQDETLELQCLRSIDGDVEQDSIADDELAKYVCDILNARKVVFSAKLSELPRRTGRTTRMLQHAIGQAQVGRAVYILARDDSHRKVILDTLRGLTDEPSLFGIKIETPASIGRQWDKHHHRLIGSHPNCLLLTDHFVSEVVVRELEDAIEDLQRRIFNLYAVQSSQVLESRRWDLKVEDSKGEEVNPNVE